MTEKTIASGTGTTNPQPNSKVIVPIDVLVKVKYRFFPASTTAKLNNTKDFNESKDLQSLPFVVGLIEGGKFTPLQKSILRLNSTKAVGGMDGESFKIWNEEEIKAWKKLNNPDSSKKEKSPPIYTFSETPYYSVKSGSVLGICIGVDTKAKHQKHPIWQITTKDNDIVIDVFETYGIHGIMTDVGNFTTRNEGTQENPKNVTYYSARLTGDNWMQSTPKLTAEDVDTLTKNQATEAMKTALKRIYDNDFDKTGADFSINVPRKNDEKDGCTVRLTWMASANENCINNIKTINISKDIPSRIHPQAYAAAAKAAHDAEIDEIKISSSWRPMVGSMPHRLSLGLDLTYFKTGSTSARINRAGLLPTDRKKRINKDNLSDEELSLYDTWKSNEKLRKEIDAKFEAAKKTAESINKKYTLLKNTTPEETATKEKNLESANKDLKDLQAADKAAQKSESDSKKSWVEEMQKNEPSSVGRYRRYVMASPCVSQVLDPWYMVGRANHKADELVPNEQDDSLAYQHNNHMHLSIRDSELSS